MNSSPDLTHFFSAGRIGTIIPLVARNSGSRAFASRRAAGAQLGLAMCGMELREPVIVLGLPRGGVPVAYEIAQALQAPLDVMIVRKIGMPGQPELAMGAIACGGIVVREPYSYPPCIERARFDALVGEARVELDRRERTYRRDRPPLDLDGKTVVLADDGIATGATMRAAVRSARRLGAAFIVVAAPVGSPEACASLRDEADRVVVPTVPPRLASIGQWYESFEQLTDFETCELLERARALTPGANCPG